MLHGTFNVDVVPASNRQIGANGFRQGFRRHSNVNIELPCKDNIPHASISNLVQVCRLDVLVKSEEVWFLVHLQNRYHADFVVEAVVGNLGM